MTHDWTRPLRPPPTTFGLWYLIGRGLGHLAVGSVNLATGATLDAWERAHRVRKFIRAARSK